MSVINIDLEAYRGKEMFIITARQGVGKTKIHKVPYEQTKRDIEYLSKRFVLKKYLGIDREMLNEEKPEDKYDRAMGAL